MINLGTVRPGSTVYVPFESFASSTGAPITLTGLATSDILVYKDGGTTQRASASGFTLLDTDGIDFDGLTGIHGVSIDLSDNTTADFWQAGSRYFVVIGDVTVDSQTMRFIAATFEIGQPGAVLNTWIATLASQTSFTLQSGPAEDDALNGMEVIIHDAASSVQWGRAIVSDYTGSTKTVTLAAGTTFTVAAKDNISVMGLSPITPTVAGRTLDVSSGGEAGVDWANVGSPTTTVGLSGTTVKTATDVETDTADIQTRLPAALGANGNIKADVRDYNGTAGTFSGGRPEVNTTHWGGTAVASATVNANMTQISGDSVAADNLEALLDGTGGVTLVASAFTLTTPITANATQISGDATAADNLEAMLDGTGGVTLSAAISGNITGNLSGSVGSVTGAVGSVTGAVGSIGSGGITAASFGAGAIDAAAIAADAIGSSELATTAVSEIVSAVLTTQMTEAYAADGVAPTLAQALFLIQQVLTEFAISGTTITIKKLDGSTTAGTLTLDSSTTPTSATRAT